MKRILLLFMVIAAYSHSANAQNYDLWAAQTNGSNVSLGLANLRSITFTLEGSGFSAATSMQANGKDGSVQTFDLAALDYLFFATPEETGIGDLNVADNKIQCTLNGVSLCVKGAEGKARVYQTDGRMCAEGHVDGNTPLHVGQLPSGIYLLRINNQTLKFSVR